MVLQKVFHKPCILEVAKSGLPFSLRWFLNTGPIVHAELFPSQDSSRHVT